jgi:SAM-dependent methyltransferase
MVRRLRTVVLPNLQYAATKSQVRRCRACQEPTLFLQFWPNEEKRLCVRCTANLRYELQAEYLREMYEPEKLDILELDPNSCLRPFLSRGHSYIRSYFRPNLPLGSVRGDGARVEDITKLSFADENLDLIVSSDVLEHVPDAAGAFRESFRVLRPGGAHVFTVPNEPRTVRRAALENGEVRHLVEPPEYHSDPLDPKGILAFWHFGPDMQQQFGDSGLIFNVVKGPEGVQQSIVWSAKKPSGAWPQAS